MSKQTIPQKAIKRIACFIEKEHLFMDVYVLKHDKLKFAYCNVERQGKFYPDRLTCFALTKGEIIFYWNDIDGERTQLIYQRRVKSLNIKEGWTVSCVKMDIKIIFSLACTHDENHFKAHCRQYLDEFNILLGEAFKRAQSGNIQGLSALFERFAQTLKK